MKEWQTLMAEGYHSVQELQHLFHFPEKHLPALYSVQENYPINVNPYYMSLIDPEDPDDPIRKMCIPTIHELNRSGSFDTSGERSNTIISGLQHKYPETALILSTNQCAMYCRHCFRKRLVGFSEEEICRHIGDIFSYIQAHTEINNVLISGGDAFMNSNETIRQYLLALGRIEHLDFIRFGTRTPVVLPQRITSDPELINLLSAGSAMKKIYVVTQFNHPREVTPESIAAINTLLSHGISVRNQAVLLKNVNDNSKTLSVLMQKLTAVGVIPYYIFQCRPVTGVMNHFQVPLIRAHQIVQETMRRQNGIGKSFRFMMSHVSGKIEILGMTNKKEMLFKYHQASNPTDIGRVFSAAVTENQCWL